MTTKPTTAAASPRPGTEHDSTGDADRGDVPGWVLVTLMTAGLVITLWAVAAPALSGVFDTAIQRVVSF